MILEIKAMSRVPSRGVFKVTIEAPLSGADSFVKKFDGIGGNIFAKPCKETSGEKTPQNKITVTKLYQNCYDKYFQEYIKLLFDSAWRAEVKKGTIKDAIKVKNILNGFFETESFNQIKLSKSKSIHAKMLFEEFGRWKNEKEK